MLNNINREREYDEYNANTLQLAKPFIIRQGYLHIFRFYSLLFCMP